MGDDQREDYDADKDQIGGINPRCRKNHSRQCSKDDDNDEPDADKPALVA